MAAKKKSAKRSAPKKGGTASTRKTTPKKKTAPKKTAASKKKTATKKASASSMDVNLGHLFSLRPRVNSSFRQNDFLTAKRALRDEKYESIADAARAVAEEALSLTRGDSARIDTNPRR